MSIFLSRFQGFSGIISRKRFSQHCFIYKFPFMPHRPLVQHVSEFLQTVVCCLFFFFFLWSGLLGHSIGSRESSSASSSQLMKVCIIIAFTLLNLSFFLISVFLLSYLLMRLNYCPSLGFTTLLHSLVSLHLPENPHLPFLNHTLSTLSEISTTSLSFHLATEEFWVLYGLNTFLFHSLALQFRLGWHSFKCYRAYLVRQSWVLPLTR